jgi:hypothetical protein
VIVVAVRWYLRYGLSYRDVEELLAERGIEVDHVTIYRWVHRFTPLLADAARIARHSPGGRWYADETYVKVNGIRRSVYRAVDQHGQVIRRAAQDPPDGPPTLGTAAMSSRQKAFTSSPIATFAFRGAAGTAMEDPQRSRRACTSPPTRR